MFRFLARVVGLVLIAGGFVGLVIDGTKSLANSSVTFTSLEELATSTFPRGFPQLGARRLDPSPSLALGSRSHQVLPVAGRRGGLRHRRRAAWLGQKPAEPIGYRAEG